LNKINQTELILKTIIPYTGTIYFADKRGNSTFFNFTISCYCTSKYSSLKRLEISKLNTMSFKIKFFNCKENSEGEEMIPQYSQSRNLDAYFEDRLKYKIKLYEQKGKKTKWLFWLTTSISMICAAIVPALINQKGDCCTLIATVLSLVVTIMVGFQGIFHPREHWRNYDMISATLRREEMLFST
jgi:Protein of unknown function (DUF4231)